MDQATACAVETLHSVLYARSCAALININREGWQNEKSICSILKQTESINEIARHVRITPSLQHVSNVRRLKVRVGHCMWM